MPRNGSRQVQAGAGPAAATEGEGERQGGGGGRGAWTEEGDVHGAVDSQHAEPGPNYVSAGADGGSTLLPAELSVAPGSDVSDGEVHGDGASNRSVQRDRGRNENGNGNGNGGEYPRPAMNYGDSGYGDSMSHTDGASLVLLESGTEGEMGSISSTSSRPG